MVREFRQLAVASGLRCEECKSYSENYLFILVMNSIKERRHLLYKPLENQKVIPVNPEFNKVWLEDFEKHIINAHPERAKAFLPITVQPKPYPSIETIETTVK